ncbi:unnamed protein product [Arabis nemorensis]|uniref:Uncharacterized protein n=1 Tax=Arabis nemorensis TaxID=586526 RepID=A0A565BBU1_9BRAS|nr:unnamed protein product [Arabis nemorensis]
MVFPDSEEPPKKKSAKERLSWSGQKKQSQDTALGQVWRQKKSTEESKTGGCSSKNSGDSILSPNKQRRLSRSDERQRKKARLNEVVEVQSPPSGSVFERLGTNSSGSGSHKGSGRKQPTLMAAISLSHSSQGTRSGEK